MTNSYQNALSPPTSFPYITIETQNYCPPIIAPDKTAPPDSKTIANNFTYFLHYVSTPSSLPSKYPTKVTHIVNIQALTLAVEKRPPKRTTALDLLPSKMTSKPSCHHHIHPCLLPASNSQSKFWNGDTKNTDLIL